MRNGLLQPVKSQSYGFFSKFSFSGVLPTVVCCNQVTVQDRVNAVLGRIITLSCIIDVGSNLSLTQTSWERRLPSGTVTLAVFNPELGTSIAQEYEGRVSFASPSVRDATITISGASFADIGSYVCKVTTFPLGNTQATTFVDVLGKAERCYFSILLSASPTCHIPKTQSCRSSVNEADITADRLIRSSELPEEALRPERLSGQRLRKCESQ